MVIVSYIVILVNLFCRCYFLIYDFKWRNERILSLVLSLLWVIEHEVSSNLQLTTLVFEVLYQAIDVSIPRFNQQILKPMVTNNCTHCLPWFNNNPELLLFPSKFSIVLITECQIHRVLSFWPPTERVESHRRTVASIWATSPLTT